MSFNPRTSSFGCLNLEECFQQAPDAVALVVEEVSGLGAMQGVFLDPTPFGSSNVKHFEAPDLRATFRSLWAPNAT